MAIGILTVLIVMLPAISSFIMTGLSSLRLVQKVSSQPLSPDTTLASFRGEVCLTGSRFFIMQSDNSHEGVPVYLFPTSLHAFRCQSLQTSRRTDVYAIPTGNVVVPTVRKPLWRIAGFTAGLLSLCIWGTVIVMFVRFVRRISCGEIFSRRNVRTLHWIGWLLVTHYTLNVLYDAWSAWQVSLQLQLTDYAILPFMSLEEYAVSITLGALALLSAHIFKHGMNMEEEHKYII
ncbi:MAG: DUF2975 domain-containing protein [Alloprevotella sp.]